MKDFILGQKGKQKWKARAVAAAKAGVYQSKCSKELEHVLVKKKLPSTWNIADITAVVLVIKERADGTMLKKNVKKYNLLYKTLKHHSKDLVIYKQVLCGTGDDTLNSLSQVKE